jgi:hypothetical protein
VAAHHLVALVGVWTGMVLPQAHLTRPDRPDSSPAPD